MNGIIFFFSITLSFLSSHAHANEHLDINFEPHILILKSKESLFYNQTIHTISNEFKKKYIVDIKNINQKPTLKDTSLIITFGTSGAIFARKNYPNIAKIFTFISLKQSIYLKLKPNETHLLIELKTLDYLNFSNKILPNKRIGILYQKPIASTLNTQNNNVYLIEVKNSHNIISATRDVIKYADVLLALPNKNIFNRHSLKGILLSTYQNKTPLVSYSPSHVKAGAVAAIYASPSDIGRHIIETIPIIMSDSHRESKRYYAKYYTVKVNQHVAQSLGLRLNDDMAQHLK